MTNINKDATET